MTGEGVIKKRIKDTVLFGAVRLDFSITYEEHKGDRRMNRLMRLVAENAERYCRHRLLSEASVTRDSEARLLYRLVLRSEDDSDGIRIRVRASLQDIGAIKVLVSNTEEFFIRK